jgi:hypothetical protein
MFSIKHITEYTKEELDLLKKFILDNIKTNNYDDIRIKGSIVIRKKWFNKFKTPSTDIDVVVITNKSIKSHIEFLDEVKISYMYKEDDKWYGYIMPYYSIITNEYFYPKDDYGVYWQIARKKLYYNLLVDKTKLDIENKMFICDICKNKYSWLEIHPYKFLSRLEDKIDIIYLCDKCNNLIFKS